MLAALAALTPSSAFAVDIDVSAAVAGATPERFGFNSGHFMQTSNTAAWWKYTGVNAARVWSTPSTVEGADDGFGFGDGVGSQQQFIDRRAALRANPLSTSYINWPYLENRYASNPTTGSNNMNLAYAYGALRGMGVDTLVTMHRTSEAYPFDDAPGTAGYWAERWEQWQHFYAQAFYLAKNFDVHRFQMYNEPNHSSTSISQSEYIERLRLSSDAVQAAVADVNAIYGKSLDVQVQGPVSAGGAVVFNERPGGDPRDDAVGWGELVMQNLHTNYLGQTDPNFQLIDTYAAQVYNLSGPGFASEVQSIKNLVAPAAAGAPMRYALSEFNVHTAAVFEDTSETMDSPSKFSLLGSILSNLANKQVEELYLQKFSLTEDDSPSGVKKNGLHYVDNDNAPYDIGGVTKGGEVARLFAKGFAGAHDLLALPAATGTGAADLSLAASHNAQRGRYSLLSANQATSQRTLDLDLAAWNVEPGSWVTVEEVSADRQGEVRQLVQVPASKQLGLTQPAQSVFLVTVPQTAPIYRVTLGATDDAMVKAGANSLTNYGTSPNLYAKNNPTNSAARNVTFIKFNLGDTATAGVDQAVLRVFGENEGTDPTVIAHVYGVASDGWNESTITWTNAPNLASGVGAVNDIAHNFIEDVGGTATVLGHFTGTQTARELMLDVTSFVKDHADSQVTFLIAREVRFDDENVDDALTSLSLASKESTSDPGPQLILSLNYEALPGDFNGDAVVDDADLAAWNQHTGVTAGAAASDGDADFDGDVDALDFLSWQRAVGTSLPATAATAVVPEPVAVYLLAAPVIFYVRFARSRLGVGAASACVPVVAFVPQVPKAPILPNCREKGKVAVVPSPITPLDNVSSRLPRRARCAPVAVARAG